MRGLVTKWQPPWLHRGRRAEVQGAVIAAQDQLAATQAELDRLRQCHHRLRAVLLQLIGDSLYHHLSPLAIRNRLRAALSQDEEQSKPDSSRP